MTNCMINKIDLLWYTSNIRSCFLLICLEVYIVQDHVRHLWYYKLGRNIPISERTILKSENTLKTKSTSLCSETCNKAVKRRYVSGQTYIRTCKRLDWDVLHWNPVQNIWDGATQPSQRSNIDPSQAIKRTNVQNSIMEKLRISKHKRIAKKAKITK